MNTILKSLTKKFAIFTAILIVSGFFVTPAAFAATGYTVSSIAVSAQSGSLTYGTGGSVTYTVTVNSAGNGQSTTATLGILGLPAGASGSFSPATVTVDGNPQTSTLTITTTATTPAGSSTFTVNNNLNSVTGTGNFIIAAEPITVTVNPGQSKVYGADDPVFTYTSSDPAATFTGALSRDPGNDIGSYTITQGNLAVVGSNYIITSFVPDLFAIILDPDIALVAADKEALVADTIKGDNPDLDNIIQALTNPLPSSGLNGSAITWASDNPDVVSSDGQTIIQPAFTSGDATVIMTATISKGAQVATKAFTLTVLRLPASSDTVIMSLSEAYSVTTYEGGGGTITGVPFGTSRADLLAALTMSEAHQTWDSSGISDPVAAGNTLVVTAEDGMTTAIYTIAASAPSTPVNLQITPLSPTNNTQPTLSWDPVLADPVVTGYVVEIYDSSETEVVYLEVEGTSFTPSEPLNDDDYTWDVMAYNDAGYLNWSDVASFTIDTVGPSVTTLGDGTSDYYFPPAATADLVFSEALNSASKSAVQAALTAGADHIITYAWNEANTTLTVTGNADSTTTFANDVVVNVSDVAGNAATLLIVDSKLSETQTAPDSETGEAIANSTTPNIVITDPNQAVNITIDSGTTNPTIDVSSFITNGTGILPAITITSVNTNNATVEIPASATVTSADSAWNGLIAAPTVTTVTLPETSGQTKTLSTAIEIGFTGAKLSFDKAVRMLLPGQAGKNVGYIRTGIAFTEITNVCAADNQATGDALAVDGDCKIDADSDLVIWTKHFTSFATYTQTTNSTNNGSTGGGGGGSGGGDSAPSISAINAVVGETTATITWQTNEVSLSWIVFGTTTAYGQEVKTTTYLASHSVTLNNLSPETTYHYQIKAADVNGHESSYVDRNFTTLALSEKMKGDINKDNKINIFDFNDLIISWGDALTNLAADLDNNGKVDIFDFNLLMVNWAD